MEDASVWYYAAKGEQVGPHSEEEIKALIAQGKVLADTKVWPGSGDWEPAKDSRLGHLFINEGKKTPPPLSGNDVDNRFAWSIVSIPILGAIIEYAAGTELAWLYLVLNIVLCVLDEQKLKKAGHPSPAKWMVIIIPVYLWKRATLLKQSRIYFGAWCVTFLLSIAINVWGENNNIEEAACPVVTDIIHQQLAGSANCKSVKITDTVSDDFYKATATLDNGNDLNITIEKQKDGQIYVRIPAN